MRESEKYCLEKYGKAFTIGKTTSDNPDFEKLPISSQIDIISHVWRIDFEEEDNIKLKTGTLREKLKVIVYRLCGRKIGHAYTNDFVDILFDFFLPILFFIILISIFSGVLNG